MFECDACGVSLAREVLIYTTSQPFERLMAGFRSRISIASRDLRAVTLSSVARIVAEKMGFFIILWFACVAACSPHGVP